MGCKKDFIIFLACCNNKTIHSPTSRIVISFRYNSLRTSIKPGFHLQQAPRPRHKTQSSYVVERSSFTLIALFWLEIGRRPRRNWPHGNQALSLMSVDYLNYGG